MSLKHRYEQAEQKIVCEEQKEELPELIYMTKVIQAHT